jgi:hypothetical protein
MSSTSSSTPLWGICTEGHYCMYQKDSAIWKIFIYISKLVHFVVKPLKEKLCRSFNGFNEGLQNVRVKFSILNSI